MAIPEKREYERVGEATELALRILAEKIGLAEPSGHLQRLESLPPGQRASYCNSHWQQTLKKVCMSASAITLLSIHTLTSAAA